MKFEIEQIKDYDAVKGFILECHKEIINKDYFIIDDIDTSLPSMFKGTGILYGAYSNKELVAVHGADFSFENHTMISPYVSGFLKKNRLAEMGWTMVKQSFRGKGIATQLIFKTEEKISDGYDFIATVHPANLPALRTYIKFGYCGVTLKNHYDKPRIFLMKRTIEPIKASVYYVEHPMNRLSNEFFEDKTILIDIKNKNNEPYGCFAKVK